MIFSSNKSRVSISGKKHPHEELIPERKFVSDKSKKIFNTYFKYVYTYTYVHGRVHSRTHTEVWTLSPLLYSIDPGALLYEEPDQSNSADAGRRRKRYREGATKRKKE